MPEQSPLAEASPASLEELFARTDPHNLTDADIDRIIAAERAYRAKLSTAAALKPEKAPRSAKAKVEEIGAGDFA